MRGTRRLVTFLSIFALVFVNFLTIGLFSSSAYEVKSGPQTSDATNGDQTAPAADGAVPVVVVPKSTGAGNGNSGKAPQTTVTQESRDDTQYKGFAVIEGYKFEDLNGNGQRDPGEPGIPGVKFTCSGFFLWQIVHETVSDADGYYKFPWCMATTWTVEELGVAGYYSTTPNPVSVTVAWWEHKQVDFGNARYGAIDGYKFKDLNGNGVKDDGEPGMPGVTIILDKGGVQTTTVTGADGWFYFNNLAVGDYTVSVDESSMPDYYPTTPTSVALSLASGETRTVAFGNAPDGSIDGYKFLDSNGNGQMDQGETGIAGVTIELSGNGINPQTKITGSDGYFSFTGLRAGAYLVRIANDIAGYYLTTPDHYEVSLPVGGTHSVYFGNAPSGTIHGYKFMDLNGNGVKDDGEPGMANVTVRLSGNGIVPVDKLTDASGYFRFSDLEGGPYLVELVNDPAGYYLTTPDRYNVSLLSGGVETVYFGNAPYGKITGYKYEDLNGNGKLDPGELPVAGVIINLLRDGEIIATRTTNDIGYFEFDLLEAGLYAVQEIVPLGAYNTSPVEVAIDLKPGMIGKADFLNAWYAEINGYKWNDLNGNGIHEEGEPPLAGVTIRIVNMRGDSTISTVTDSNGWYEFTGLAAGTWKVSEVVPEGYRPTTPDQVELTLQSGDSREVNFLNTSEIGSIAGTKWNDLNGNGVVDIGETGLSGVTIQLWVGIDLMAEAVSGTDGTYAFEDLPAGDYIVMEVVPQGFYPTSTTSRPVALAAGEARTGVDFLNSPFASISGTKWDDPDQDGVHTSGEAPVPGVTITLSRAGMVDVTAVTDADGKYSFGKLEAGAYTVSETLPTGTKNTTPSSVTVALKPGDKVSVNFLNVAVGGDIIVPPVNPTTPAGSSQLPYTGMNQLAYYLAAALLMLLGLFATLLGIFRNHAMAGKSREPQIGKWM
jgi:uncharacterized protein (DUF2141 family)